MLNPESQVSPDLIPPLDPDVLSLSETEMTFLRTCISPDDNKVRERILDIQKRAYAEYPYPCVRAFNFVNLFMAQNPIYSAVVDAGRGGHTLFLDLGCHMGTDVRKLVCDGYPAPNVFGCDLRPQYFEFGYDLFGDAGRCPIRFFADNIFDVPCTIFESPGSAIEPDLGQGTTQNPPDLASVTNLSQLHGTLTHIYTGALFHLFNEETQYTLALQLAGLLKRSPGATVFGRHQGLEKAGKIDDHLGRDRYGHSEASWPVMWRKVFALMEGDAFASSHVIVQAELRRGFAPTNVSGGKRRHDMLYWSVQIV